MCQKVQVSEAVTKDLVCVYLNYMRKRPMIYDLECDSLKLLIDFMKRVLERDPQRNLIKIRSIKFIIREDTGDLSI